LLRRTLGFRRRPLDGAEFDHFALQETQDPAGVAVRRPRTGESDPQRVRPPSISWPPLARPRLTAQHGVETFLRKLLARTTNRRRIGCQRSGRRSNLAGLPTRPPSVKMIGADGAIRALPRGPCRRICRRLNKLDKKVSRTRYHDLDQYRPLRYDGSWRTMEDPTSEARARFANGG
jgi:hypothetical protein